MRTMLRLTPRCNFCLLIIHAFLEGAEPALRVQTAVRRERTSAGVAAACGRPAGLGLAAHGRIDSAYI